MLSLQILNFNAICIKLERVLIEHICVRCSLSVATLAKGARRPQMVPAGAKSKHLAC